MDRSKEQLEEEIRIRGILDEEREKSNNLYAIKLVEKIVFTLVGLLAIGVVMELINLVIHK